MKKHGEVTDVTAGKVTGRAVSTENLMKLLETSVDLSATLAEHPGDFAVGSFSELLKTLLLEHGLSVAALEQRSLLSRSFTYQLLRGDRVPGRDIVLRLAIALHCSVDETQRLLRLAQRGILYPRVERDAVLLYALYQRMDITEANELLSSLGQTTLV